MAGQKSTARMVCNELARALIGVAESKVGLRPARLSRRMRIAQKVRCADHRRYSTQILQEEHDGQASNSRSPLSDPLLQYPWSIWSCTLQIPIRNIPAILKPLSAKWLEESKPCWQYIQISSFEQSLLGTTLICYLRARCATTSSRYNSTRFNFSQLNACVSGNDKRVHLQPRDRV